MSRKLSLPHEHGGYLTLVGASLASALVSPDPIAAIGVGVAVTAAFLARGALDRVAVRAPLHGWDGVALLVLAAAAAGGIALAARGGEVWALVTIALCAAMVIGSMLVRRAHKQRHAGFELVAMTGLGGSAGLGALAAGASAETATVIAVIIGTHAGLAVPLVRTEVRRRERHHRPQAVAGSALWLLTATAAVAVLGRPIVALAFVPRAAQILHRALREVAPQPPSVVGARETAVLAAVVALAAITA